MEQNPRVWNKFEWTQVEGSLTQDEIGFRIQSYGFRGMTVFFMLISFGFNFAGFTIFFASMSTAGLGGEMFARMNKQPRHGVGLKFNNAKPLKFGVTLSPNEQNWMMSEMIRFLQS
jgi:hypothetical protein